MKRTQHCIKCNSTKILKIKGGSTWTGYQNFIHAGGLVPVLVTRYLCSECGYSEEWVDDPKGLIRLKKKYGGDDSYNEYV